MAKEEKIQSEEAGINVVPGESDAVDNINPVLEALQAIELFIAAQKTKGNPNADRMIEAAKELIGSIQDTELVNPAEKEEKRKPKAVPQADRFVENAGPGTIPAL